ncbi:hypothetical protein WAF17_04990 [Bernardetia sp. ABR2-2B]|uniref:hypothetical protein n=1 Tax=Bernardetia sp. ABR2-2B TaxID=3127472 RepID=UPI0030CAD368
MKYTCYILFAFLLSACSLDESCSLNLAAWKTAKATPLECRYSYSYDEKKSLKRFSQLECVIDTLKIGMSRQHITQMLGSGDTCQFEKGHSTNYLYVKKGVGKEEMSELYFHTLSETTIPYVVNHNGSSIDALILKFDNDTLKTVFFANGW